MSYPREAVLEKYIKDFVFHEVAEVVDLHIKTGDISIRHISKKGSILLAKLWANVLQHSNNYPPYDNLYKRQRDSQTGEEHLLVKADDLHMTLHMKTGTLQIQGKFVIEWFSRKFGGLLDNYNKKFADSWQYQPSKIPIIDVTKEREPLNDYMTKTEKYQLCLTTHLDEKLPLEQKMSDYTMENIIPGIGDLAVDLHVWDPEKVETELIKLKVGAVKDACQFIYPLWRSLLNSWFGAKGTRVYMASPHIDLDRLNDMVDIFLHHKPLTNLEAFYTSSYADKKGTKKTAETKEQVLQKYDLKIRPYIEYHIYRRLLYPMRKFGGNFLAGVKGGVANILVTSANFHGDHFAVENYDTVMYIKLSEAEFHEKYVKPIASQVVGTEFEF